MKCDPNHIKKAADYSTLPLSGSQVLLIWDKPIGYGYDFKVEVNVGSAVLKAIEGTMEFGNAKALVVGRLQPLTTYTFNIFHKCSSSTGAYVPRPKHVDAKTLDKG